MGGYGSSYSYDTDDSVTRKSAASYNIDAGRRYEVKGALPPPLGKVLITEAKLPLVVAVDVTGSMRKLPGIIFEKLCILYNEALFFLPEYLKESFEVSFAAIGDATCDRAPIQVTDFASGYEMDENIKSLYPEGGGGGGYCESYELVAYYFAKHCEMPGNTRKDPRPLFIFVGDENYYGEVDKRHIKDLIGDELPSNAVTKDVFEQLKTKFDVHILRVKYDDTSSDGIIQSSWEAALGEEKVILMEEPQRTVDIILGLLAAHVGEVEKFEERIEVRQTPEQVKQVYKALARVIG